MSESVSSVNRRHFLAASAAAATALAGRPARAESTADLPWIDAHSHIWTSDVARFPLAPGMSVENLNPRDFGAQLLLDTVRPHGVGRVVLIHHTPFHGFDNTYLTDAWRRFPDQFRVVGIVDDLRPHCGKAMKQLGRRGVTGFRIAPRKGVTNWLQTDGMQEMWATAAESRQPMCCLINPEELADVDAACQRFPDTPVVIDHFARIGIDGEVRDTDLKSLCQLARFPYVKVKISAYYALGARKPPYDDLIPMIRRLYESYGARRLMWASDCPYQLTRNNTYDASIGLIRDRIDFVSDEERRHLLCTTAEETFFFA